VPLEALRRWYADDLQRKIARAAMEGRVDTERAAELHRLMTELLDVRVLHRA
jgi:hypothetical protein